MLPYSREVLFSLFGELNHSFAAAQLIAVAVWCMVAFGLARSRSRFALTSAAVLWAACAVFWFFHLVAPINFLGPVYAGLALLQGIALLFAAIFAPSLRASMCPILFFFGCSLAITAADWLTGPGWPMVRLPGLFPALLVFLNAAIVSQFDSRKIACVLSIAPLLLAAVSTYEGFVLEIPQNYVVIAGAFAGIAFVFFPQRFS